MAILSVGSTSCCRGVDRGATVDALEANTAYDYKSIKPIQWLADWLFQTKELLVLSELTLRDKSVAAGAGAS